jgi:excisionase family DNA binding protein
MTSNELAIMLKISRRKLEAMVKAGSLPPFVKIGRARRWEYHAVREWFKEITPPLPSASDDR